MESAPKPHTIGRDELEQRLGDFLKEAKKPLLAITGPTASGKTGLSIQLCKKYNGEVINADSRQFFQGMDIGTAKITEDEKEGVPHHLINFLKPDQTCTAGGFKKIAEEKTEEILGRKKIPFLVGGSGLFVEAVCKNFQIETGEPDWEFRAEMEQKDPEELWEKLKEIDPQIAEKINPHNVVRIVRYLEMAEKTGKIPSELMHKDPPKYDHLIISIWTDPEVLAEKIEKRTEQIWGSGFLEEVEGLMKNGYGAETPSMIAHGYREAMQYLQNEISKEEAMRLMSRNTRRYAKRQRTWWRRVEDVVWVHL